jgi:ABC-type polysaccharide/polyol phosphate transport system ATPase subunit
MISTIQFESVSKRYYLGATRRSLREAMARSTSKVLRQQGDHQHQEFWALRDVTFEVGHGEALGIVGPNGAGKTTILKLLSRVTQPTKGRIKTDGRVAALIELGAGFHPDLTGRENVFLNGTIMGLSQREIRRRFDSIVAFAELEQFIDTPIKRYSSGMYARLGFSVAAHVDPDILLVDEVLSVGDEAFQQKCFHFIHAFVESGRTSVFVSHSLYAIEQLCDRLIWLDHGGIAQQGDPATVLRAYMDETDRHLISGGQDQETFAGDQLRINTARVMDAVRQPSQTFCTGDDIVVAIDYETDKRLNRPYFCVWISEAGSHIPLLSANMLLDNFPLPHVEGPGTLECRFKSTPLMPRAYNVWVEVYGEDRAEILYKWRPLGGFRILDPLAEASSAGDGRGSVRFSRAHGPIRVPYEWQA